MKKALLIAAFAALSLSASAIDYYMVGDNVDGYKWECAVPETKFEAQGDGVFVWKGKELGTGFKINDGTWNYELAAPGGAKLTVGEDFWYSEGGDNIAFTDCTLVKDPVVTLNTVEGTLKVDGTKVGQVAWYFTGTFNDYFLDLEMTEIEAGVFQVKNVALPESGEFKVTTTGWGEQYGSPTEAPAEITPESLTAVLGVVGSTNACPFTLQPGSYDITWNYATTTVTFTVVSLDPTPDPEPDPDPDHVSLKVVTLNGMGISSQVAKGAAATVNFGIDSYWKVESLTFNGADVTSDIIGSSFTTPKLEADAEVEVSVTYDGVLITDNPTGVTEVSGSEVTVNVAESSVLIKGLKAGDEVMVYDLTGRVIAAQNVSKDVLEIRLENNNCYIIRINNEAVKVKL